MASGGLTEVLMLELETKLERGHEPPGPLEEEQRGPGARMERKPHPSGPSTEGGREGFQELRDGHLS